MLILPAQVINPYVNKSLPYQPLAGFTPISQITRSAYILVTSSQSSFKTVRDFGASEQPSISFASAGPGSAPHLAGQLFVTLLGVESLHIPYPGGAPAMVGVIRGEFDM